METEGIPPSKFGKKLFLREDGTFTGTIGSGQFEREAMEDAKQAIKRSEKFFCDKREVIKMSVVEVLKVISDTNRLRILNLLNVQELCVCELEYLLGISQSNLSKHLRLMSDAGFLESRRQNKFAYYKIDASVFSEHPFLTTIFEEELNQEALFLDELNKLSNYQNSELTCHTITALIV